MKTSSQDPTRTTTGEEGIRNEPDNGGAPGASASQPQTTDRDDADAPGASASWPQITYGDDEGIKNEPDNGDAPGASASRPPTTDGDDEYVALLRDHPYLPRFQLSDVRATEYVLPSEFQWTVCNLNDERTCDEVCKLLKTRAWDPYHLYNYSNEYIRWSLCPPGYFMDWHIGVRQVSSGNLVAFIAAIPTRIRVRDAVLRMADCRYMSMKPGTVPREVVFSEMLRRVNSRNVWQQVYRWESFLPAPIAVSPLWQRSLHPNDLIGLGYSIPRPRMSTFEISRECSLSDFLRTPGIRKMEASDVPAVTVLLRNYLSQFAVAPAYTEEEVNHWLLPRKKVLDSFVIETLDDDREITDFFSYTRLIQSPGLLKPLHAAYLFYYASSKTPLPMLMRHALLASGYNMCALFFATDVMNNGTFLNKLSFKPTGAKVQYNLNNFPMDLLQSSQVGLMLQFAN